MPASTTTSRRQLLANASSRPRASRRSRVSACGPRGARRPASKATAAFVPGIIDLVSLFRHSLWTNARQVA